MNAAKIKTSSFALFVVAILTTLRVDATKRLATNRQPASLAKPTAAPNPDWELAQACLPCAPGCFDTARGCMPGTTNDACGVNGATCSPCTGTTTCQGQACVSAPTCASSCAGCCSNNQCVPIGSETDAVCGTGAAGATCGACATGAHCVSGACCTPVSQAVACSGQTCGTIVGDGCGGLYACSTCTPGFTCGKCDPGVCYPSNAQCR